MALYMRCNVVSIAATPKSGLPRYGFGFIIAEQADAYIILTADHVVRNHSPQDDDTTITVNYFNQTDKPYPAKLTLRHDESFDIAVLRAKKPASYRWIKKVLADEYDIKRSEKVWFVGRDNDWYVPTDYGKIYEVGLHRLSIEKLNAHKGTSGAPLISPTGIIGLLLFDSSSTTSDITRAISIKKIKEAIDFWQDIPWQLEPSVLSRRGSSKIRPQLHEAETKTQQIFSAFDQMDIDSIASICGSPVAFDKRQFNSTAELKNWLQKTKEQQNGHANTRHTTVEIDSAMTILEAVSEKGWRMDGWIEDLFSKLDLGYEDIAVLIHAGQTQENLREGVLFFRNTTEGVKLAFVSG